MGRLEGKVAIVTGSSSGLGRAIALEYVKEGALLVCADLQPNARPEVPQEAVVNTHDLIKQQGGKAIFVKTDVGVAIEVEAMIQAAVLEYERLDMPPARIHETSEEIWDITMKVNTKSVFLGCKYAITQMLSQEPHASGDRGWIINMSSIYGLVGGNFNSAYAASKGAVANLTRQIAVDYGDSNIHCNAICPGYTRTAIFARTTDTLHSLDKLNAQHPLKGVGEVGDIVGAAVFLACQDANWITGVCLPVDGGFTAQ